MSSLIEISFDTSENEWTEVVMMEKISKSSILIFGPFIISEK